MRALASLVICVLFFWTFVCPTDAESDLTGPVTDHVVAFPYVVTGTAGGRFVETVVIISNPAGEPLSILVSPSQSVAGFVGFLGGPVGRNLELAAFESRQIVFHSADSLVSGSLLLEGKRPFGADAHFLIKASQSSSDVMSRVALPGSTPTNRVAFPVRIGSALADNTSFALATFGTLPSGAYYRASLYDTSGQLVGQTKMVGKVMFVTELFPDLPDDFHSGTVLVDTVSSVDQAMVFSLIALYTAGDQLFTASPADMEKPGLFGFLLQGPDYDSQLQALQSQYHFEVKHHTAGYPAVTMRSTREVARVMAKDPRVKAMDLNVIVDLS